ncbi:hypothetical protein BKA66DRAFT_15684 [Pyrenochaeta sp. MPI-SDFR-AT-0127]|nr:hypothetical protein BKA66DRAFT_15684 [Pyrenochaeta sp. MPI-SDFR-AT-0127]
MWRRRCAGSTASERRGNEDASRDRCPPTFATIPPPHVHPIPCRAQWRRLRLTSCGQASDVLSDSHSTDDAMDAWLSIGIVCIMPAWCRPNSEPAPPISSLAKHDWRRPRYPRFVSRHHQMMLHNKLCNVPLAIVLQLIAPAPGPLRPTAIASHPAASPSDTLQPASQDACRPVRYTKGRSGTRFCQLGCSNGENQLCRRRQKYDSAEKKPVAAGRCPY